MRSTSSRTDVVARATLTVLALTFLCASAGWADNTFLSRPRVLRDGEWQVLTLSHATTPKGAVSKTAFDMTISYHDTLSADSVPAGDPKRALALKVEEVIKFWSDALYEQSNGQHMLGTVYIYQGAKFADKSSVVWKASAWPTGAIGGYGKPGQCIQFGDVFNATQFISASSTNTDMSNGGYTLGHETGHFVYALFDEYVANYGAAAPWTWPKSTDVVPSDPSIMNDQWSAMSTAAGAQWLNHSTTHGYSTSTDTAQKRVYGKNCWEILTQDPALDSVDASVRPGRVQYSFATVPASPDWIRTEITPGTHFAAAQANLKIVWLDQAAMVYQIVIDHSGSMSGSPLANAQAAAQSLVESTPKETAIGVVQFNESASQIYPITFIPSDDAGARTVKSAAKAAIAGISSGGNTAIYDAASLALSNFLTYKAGAASSVLGVTYLLTDGDDNSSSKSLSAVIAEHQAAKVPLITVGYGSGGAANSALTQMADETGGQYFTSPTTQAELQKVFFAAQGNYSDVVNLGAQTISVAAGATSSATFRLDSLLATATFFASYAGTGSPDVTLTVRDPNGNAVAGSPVFVEGSGRVDYSNAFANSTSGAWTLEMRNNTASAISVSVAATAQPGSAGTGFSLTVGLADGGSSSTTANPIRLGAWIARGGTPVTGVTVSATLTDPDDVSSALTMRDDGTNGDATAQDGLYSAIVTSPKVGTYKLDVSVSNPSGTAQETLLGYSPSKPGPGGGTLNPLGAVIAENFARSTSFQVKIAQVTVTPTPAPSPTVTPAPTVTSGPSPTSNPTVAPTAQPGGGGGGGGCSNGIDPISVLLFVPLLLTLRKR